MKAAKEISIKTTSPWFVERFSFWVLNLGRKQDSEIRVKQLQKEIQTCGLKPGQSILDVGCGLGDWAVLCKKKVGAKGYVAGIAPGISFIEASRRTARDAGVEVDFRIGNMESLEFENNSFDLVTCTAVMMNVKDRTKLAGLREMFRVLKPGGKVVISDLAKPPRTWQLPLNFWYYRMIYGVFGKVFWQGRFPEFLTQAGFVNLEVTPPENAFGLIFYFWMCDYIGLKGKGPGL